MCIKGSKTPVHKSLEQLFGEAAPAAGCRERSERRRESEGGRGGRGAERHYTSN